MGKTLIIAEKPSVARDIAKVLKINSKGDGFLFNDTHIISWSVGHLVTLCDPEDYNAELKPWRLNTLPIIPKEIKLKPIERTRSQLKILDSLMNSPKVSHIVCATDSGREGELIFRYIYSITKCTKPFSRLWISSLTPEAIKTGFENLKDGKEFDCLYNSAKCRSEADWLVGINATRAYTIQYKTLLSMGRVQTPTLAIVVAKQKEIDAFVAVEYWELNAGFDGYNGTWFDPNTGETKILNKTQAKDLEKAVKGKDGIVEKIENELKKQAVPLLYDLTQLQRDCNKKYGYSAKQTLEIAQTLYEKRKVITYPRTDSRHLSTDMIPKLKKTLQSIRLQELRPYVDYVLNLTELPINKRIIDDTKVTDHHAIIPTDISFNPQSLSKDELQVYDMIARRFICVFYPQYEYNVTKITSLAENQRFLTKGTTVINYGYMELYKDSMKTNEEPLLPNVKEGDKIQVRSTEILHKKTQPPKPYTEATLLTAMENAGRFVESEEYAKDSGLGTPATRAAIIERLLTVGYIERKGKALIPTEKGKLLIEAVPDEIKSPETTGKWEKGLTSISKGTMQSERFMQSIKRFVEFIIAGSSKNPNKICFPRDEDKKEQPQNN